MRMVVDRGGPLCERQSRRLLICRLWLLTIGATSSMVVKSRDGSQPEGSVITNNGYQFSFDSPWRARDLTWHFAVEGAELGGGAPSAAPRPASCGPVNLRNKHEAGARDLDQLVRGGQNQPPLTRVVGAAITELQQVSQRRVADS